MPARTRPITTEDLWALKRLGAPTLSPDGAWACVTVTQFDMDDNRSTSALWLLSTDGKIARQLTAGPQDSDPQWSPDGKWIAFIAKRGPEPAGESESQIYVIPADGGEAQQLTRLATGASAPRWFPDSRRIAFVSWVWPELSGEKAQAKRLKREKADPVKAIVIDKNHYRYWDHWFPRGRVPHLHLVARDKPKTRDLFAGTGFHLAPQEPGRHQFDISPDGAEIAFAFDFEPDPRAFSLCDIVAMDVETGAATNLTAGTGAPGQKACEAPSYSPDGAWIAYLATDCLALYNAEPRLCLIERASGARRDLTSAWDRGVAAPLAWSAASDALYFCAEEGVARPIWRCDIAGSHPVERVRGPGYGGTVSDFCVSADGGTIAYLRSSQTQPPCLYAGPIDGSDERPIERFNAPLLAKLRLASARSVTIAGFEGAPVQMWVMDPPDADPADDGRQWPLMQVIHGGPHTCSGDVWHWRWNLQRFAAAGYVVAAVNYHGSTGWGQAFLSSINGDWGRRELADIEAGTDHLLATGRIDRARMVATGGSYGGYMVAYMNGHLPADRYQAYVCHAGCYDWVAMIGSDGYFWLGNELGAFPWEDEARVLAQSPHHRAADFATPTLILHGERDYRVPYYQGLAYYNTLRARRIAARLVFFPDENHWILKPRNSRLWYQEFLDWCDRHTLAKKPKRKKSRA